MSHSEETPSLGCERSIIGSDPAGRHHCAFKIVSGNVSELWRAGSEAGSYVLSSVGEKANLLCESKIGRVYTFLPAVYHIHLPGGCTLHGTDQDWILEGRVTITSSVSVRQSPVSIKILHDIRHLSQEQQLHLAQVPDWIPVKDFPAVLPTSIPPLAPLSFLDRHGVLPVLNSSSSLIVIGTLVTIGLYLTIKYKCRKTSQQSMSPSAPPEESRPLFIYPKLSNLTQAPAPPTCVEGSDNAAN